jgi:hypothetical protein
MRLPTRPNRWPLGNRRRLPRWPRQRRYTGETARAQFSLYVMGAGDHMAEIMGCIDFLKDRAARSTGRRISAPG